MEGLKEKNLRSQEELDTSLKLRNLENQEMDDIEQELEAPKLAEAEKSQQFAALQEENIEAEELFSKEVMSNMKDEEISALNSHVLKIEMSFVESACLDFYDTKDCPIQEQEEDESLHWTRHGRQNEERPYCYVCQVFGHLLSNCNQCY